ncbi:RagB/SusD family nutrient uptake outer membrane protein [Labilithrix luteola]|nr:RagB/SusD family nutrient uptake outer membrane protein [Labilithrix luteola]
MFVRSARLLVCSAFILALSPTLACSSDDGAALATNPDSGAPIERHDPIDGGSDSSAPVDRAKCSDGVMDAAETDVDCGGGCAPCGQCQRCLADADCETTNCADGICGPVKRGYPQLSAERGEIRNLLATVEAGMRCDMDVYVDAVGIVGREMYRFSSKEPRYTTDLLGGGTSVLASDAFYVTRPWTSRYWVARNAKRLETRSANATDVTATDKKGYAAVAETVLAYQLLLDLTLSDEQGLRVDVENDAQPARTKDEVLAHVMALLDDAKANLPGATFDFSLSSGFEGFDTPSTFLKFNRALAARVAAYQKNWPLLLTTLGESFLSLNADLRLGVYMPFTNVPGDARNSLFTAPNGEGDVRVAHPSFATDVATGDDRLLSTVLRSTPASQAGLTSNRDAWRYTSATAPFPIIRNEELVLLYAEARAQLGQFPDAIVAINRIRSVHNVSPYAGAVTPAALLNEILYQRRYSLFLEGHRWVDVRRFGALGTLPVDRPDDDVWSSFPVPKP